MHSSERSGGGGGGAVHQGQGSSAGQAGSTAGRRLGDTPPPPRLQGRTVKLPNRGDLKVFSGHKREIIWGGKGGSIGAQVPQKCKSVHCELFCEIFDLFTSTGSSYWPGQNLGIAQEFGKASGLMGKPRLTALDRGSQ